MRKRCLILARVTTKSLLSIGYTWTVSSARMAISEIRIWIRCVFSAACSRLWTSDNYDAIYTLTLTANNIQINQYNGLRPIRSTWHFAATISRKPTTTSDVSGTPATTKQTDLHGLRRARAHESSAKPDVMSAHFINDLCLLAPKQCHAAPTLHVQHTKLNVTLISPLTVSLNLSRVCLQNNENASRWAALLRPCCLRLHFAVCLINKFCNLLPFIHVMNARSGESASLRRRRGGRA